MPPFTIRPIAPSDAGEVLTVQRAAFVAEALIYGDPDMRRSPRRWRRSSSNCARTSAASPSRAHDWWVSRAPSPMASCCWSGGSRSRPTSKAKASAPRLLEAVEQRGAESGCRRAELFTGSLQHAEHLVVRKPRLSRERTYRSGRRHGAGVLAEGPRGGGCRPGVTSPPRRRTVSVRTRRPCPTRRHRRRSRCRQTVRVRRGEG